MNITQMIFRWLPDVLYFKELNLMKQNWFFYNWVKRHLQWAKQTVVCSKATPPYKVIENQTIFMYWKQGWKNAPELVQKCLESVKENANGHPLVLLDASNLHQYIKFPDFIEDKHNKGIIPEANFSDMLRVALLYQYGGFWMDATCFLSSPIPAVIEHGKFFMFQRHLFADWASPIKCSNWFIYGVKGSPVLLGIKNWLFQYWMHKSYVINYFMFHFVISALVEEDKACRETWQSMPYICNMNPHVLLFNFGHKYDEGYYKFILNSCFVHKLTYKYDKKMINSQEENMLMHFLD